ncbi:MAG: hypothetical protein ACYCWW_14730, partial [Deltaproteobacteria bacterium]
MARSAPQPKMPSFLYAGDETFAAQLQTLEIKETVESVKKRIEDYVRERRLVSPTSLLGEIVGPEKQEDLHPEDPETVQAFAMNFLALWNEEAAKIPEDEE